MKNTHERRGRTTPKKKATRPRTVALKSDLPNLTPPGPVRVPGATMPGSILADYGTGVTGDRASTPVDPLPEPVAPKDAKVEPSKFGAFGASGTFNYGGFISQEDYNPKLDGLAALVIYDEMRKSDGQVQSTLRSIKLPLMAASWVITPPKDGDERDQEIADYCAKALLSDGSMPETPWSFILYHILLMLEFGFSVLEKVWKVGDDGMLTYARISPRLPRTIYRWITNPDGSLRSIIQLAPKVTVNESREVITQYGYWEIPREYAFVIINEREGDNYYGRSILRSAYQHWFYKTQSYRIDAVSQDRYGVGIPVATLTEAYEESSDGLKAIEKNLKGLRSHEKAWLIEPVGVTYRILTTEAKGMSPNIIASVEHHNVMIAANVLAGFLTQGQQRHGSFGAASTIAEQFNSALKGIAAHISSEVKAQLIKPLCDANFDMRNREYPALTANDMNDADTTALADILAKLAPAGLITPDDTIEEYLRKINGLPPMPDEVKRANQPKPEETPVEEAELAPEEPEEPGSPELRVAATKVFLHGTAYARHPTPLEQRVLAYKEIPERLDAAKGNLVHALAAIRRKQLHEFAKKIAAKDARPTGEFTDLRHGVVGKLPFAKEMRQAIRATQTAMADYGRRSVRDELIRQGAPAEKVMMAKVDGGAQKTTSALVTSADISIKRMTDAWESQIMEVAYKLRKKGLQGDDLVDAIESSLADAIEAGARKEATHKVNESYALGRAAEAADKEAFIGSVEYSALMDPVTCKMCGHLDGTVVDYGSEEYYEHLPPNPSCYGKDACRCVYLYIYNPLNKGGEDAWVNG